MLKESIVTKPSPNGRLSARPGSSMGSASKPIETKPNTTPTRLARPASKPINSRAVSP